MAHWLGRKYKSNMSRIMRRFRKGDTLGTKTIMLIMPNKYKAQKRLVKTWHNPYIEKEEVGKEKERIKRESLFTYDNLWTGKENRQGGTDLREEVILLKGTTEADRMKHLQPICPSCHRAKTKTDLKVLSRMR